MSMRRKWWKPALLALVLLIGAQAAVSLLVQTRRMHGYLLAHLERSFGRPVEVGVFKVQILPTPQLEADGVTIAEDPAFGYEYFLRAEHLAASLRWTGLLRGHFEFGTLSLSHPSLILVRNKEGKWNLERWLPPAKTNPAAGGRVYGPQQLVTPANYLQKIEIDDGRVNFKSAEEKLPFAFTGVSGSVEQVAPGRWQLQLEAQPWRSGVALQSTGILSARGDIAGTSARLQPAEVNVHWEKVSLADLFRLIRGQDYGVRGEFALDGIARSGVAPSGIGTNDGAPAAQPGEWTFALQARAAQMHRSDLTERADNPRINVNMKGRWNVAAGSAIADQLSVETPKSNLRGMARFSSVAASSWEVHVDSAGVQAADLLTWYRAFHPGVAEGVTAEQFFTGAMSVRGWPLEIAEAAFSSSGGEASVPGFSEPLHVGAVRGGRQRSKLLVEPMRISLGRERQAAAEPAKSAAVAKRRTTPELRNAVELALLHDFETQSGSVSLDGQVNKIEDVLKVAAAFGRPLNHGWELTGAGSAALHWDWTKPLAGKWNGKIEMASARLQVVGLNQPLQIGEARLEWEEGKRTAQIGNMEGFGAAWSGEIAEANATSAETGTQWNFQLHADHLNAAELDRWVGPRARPNWLQSLLPSLLGGTAPSPAASELLRRVNAEGELRVDELSVEKVKLTQVRAEGSLRNLQMDVRASEAHWAGGNIRAKMKAEFSPRPKYDVTAELDRVDVAQLPTPRLVERFGGVVSGTVHLTTGGVGREELLQKLAGQGEVRLKNVEFRGWDVVSSVEDGTPHTGTSRWLTGDGAFSVRDRSVVLDGLQLDTPRGRALVQGTVSFAREADLTIETTNAGKRGPRGVRAVRVLKISGPLDGPRVSVESPKAPQPAD